MRIDGPAKEIILKVVYYGPGMAGKTTNLTIIHDRVPSNAAGDLQVVDTHSERTLRFDLLGVDLGQMLGHNLRFDFFTVPGQSYYAATRRAVLAGTDGVVFVADSRREALDENIEAMNEMLNSLRHHGLPEDLPVVIQYNKQDLPTALKPEQLEPLLNIRGWPSHSSVARDGTGVMETMQAITRLTREWALASDNLPETAAVPVPVKAEPPATWLISCYRCQAMLEVPEAKVGSLYACGVCSSQLEVFDSERGLTRAPAAAPKPITGRVSRDDSDYGLQTISDSKNSALGSGAKLGPPASVGTPFEVSGYDLIDMLDENPMGRRSRVRERANGRILRAVTINPVLLRQPGYAEALEPHVRLASQVKHPYILPLAALHANNEAAVIFSSDSQDYEHLGLVLARRRALAPPHAMGILRQVALALEEAARHGVVHGWLRPEVILVNPEGAVQLDELAFPKNHRFLIRELSGASAATEYYLAPEHIHGESRSDVRSDIFMLGSLLFRMFTGEGLVTGYNAHEALHKIVANGARSLRSVQAGISRDLELFYQRMVMTERKDRYQTYRELIDALDQFGGGAKRQTMRLTQSVSSPGTGMITGTGAMRRPGTGQMRRPGTTELPRGLGGGHISTAAHRAQINTPEFTTTTIRKRKPEPKSSMYGLVIFIAVFMSAGLVLMFVFVLQPAKSEPPADEKAQTIVPDKVDPHPPVDPTGKHQPQVGVGPVAPQIEHDHVVPATPTHEDTAPPIPVVGIPVVKETPTEGTGGAVDPPKVPGEEVKERGGTLRQIAELERQGYFKKALDMCDSVPTPEERNEQILRVGTMHGDARRDVESAVQASHNIIEITALLEPARDNWGLDDDADWAAKQLAAANLRLGQASAVQPKDPPVKPPVIEPVEKIPPTVAPAKPVSKFPVVLGEVLDLLATNSYQQVLPLISTLPADSPGDTIAINRLLEIWNRRGEIINRVMVTRNPLLIVSHPTSLEQWFIAGADASGLNAKTSGNSSCQLIWNQVQTPELAQICAKMADDPLSKPDERELAVVMSLVVKQPVTARSLIRRFKSTLDTRAIGDYEQLIRTEQLREALDMVKKADAALSEGQVRVVARLIEQLKLVDPEIKPVIASDLARLQGKDPIGRSALENNHDHLTFKDSDDLAAFSEHSGWQIANGVLRNTNDSARVERRDLKDAHTASLTYQPAVLRGTMNVDFRGVRVILDFSNSTFQVHMRDKEILAHPFVLIPKASNSIFFEVQPDKQVRIEFNNNVNSFSLAGGDLTDSFSVTVGSGAAVALQDFQITRSASAVVPTHVEDERQQGIRVLGWDPLGKAYLDSPLIILPASGDASKDASGIGLPLRDNIIGLTFDCKGNGPLRIQMCKAGDRLGGDIIEVPMHASVTGYKITWSATVLNVVDSHDAPIKSIPLTGPHEYLKITAVLDATVMNAPVLIHK